MKKLLFFCVLCVGCQPATETTKKYTVVSTFNDVVLETDDKAEAYETAHNLTMMGRIFQSKPCYFVVEANNESKPNNN